MEVLFVTWDQIGSQTGGGVVTYNELEFLKELGNVTVFNPQISSNPFEADDYALNEYLKSNKKYKLAHFYSNTYSNLIRQLKKDGTKITYTAAAHDIEKSKEEHLKNGIDFNLPHLTDCNLFKKYIDGYLHSDIVICPSKHSSDIMLNYGCKNIKIIPHGITSPEKSKIPKFSVGYLGSVAPDKGVSYLLEAWSILNYSDTLLTIAGKNSIELIEKVRTNKGSIFLAGFIPEISDFYNQCTVYVQPSVTEGFGIEVIEAMSYRKAVICSSGAGASDCIINGINGTIVPSKNPEAIANAIDYYKQNQNKMLEHGMIAGINSKTYLWENIKKLYHGVWNELLSSV